MHGLPRDTGFGRLVQILIAQHKVSRAVGVQNQQRLFKAGKISHQVLEITAVFGVTVHHQLLKTAGLHAPQNLVQTFLDSGIRQHDRLWQRVGPGLEPYPETTAEAMPRREELPPAQESQLPGAEPNPCCMGSEARELLAVLEGYIEEELEDRRRYLALSRQAPSWARQTLRDMAEEENGHARRLMAARYLITGQPYRPNLVCGVFCPGRWAEELRRSYHEEACGGLNYARTADGTTDVCLVKLLNELSEDELLLRV